MAPFEHVFLCLYVLVSLARSMQVSTNASKHKVRVSIYAPGVFDSECTTADGSEASQPTAEAHAVADGEEITSEMQRPFISYSNFNTEKGQRLPVDAWLYMAHGGQTLDHNMYTPILLTVEAALESLGAHVRVVDTQSAGDMPTQIRKRVADTGKAPLVMVVAHWWGGDEARNIIRQCPEAGAHLVFYQTEPGRSLAMFQDAVKSGAHEVWDYNMRNIVGYPTDHEITVRYVPPGYLSKLKPHVNMTSEKRDESMIGFMAQRGTEARRSICKKFGPLVAHSKGVWTSDDFNQWVETYPMQLNLHKSESTRDGVEAFRLSVLLSFKACVISILSNEEDMHKFEGIVEFADEKQLVDVFRKVTGTATGVQDCQSASFENFRKRFDPEVILQNSGLMTAWQVPF